MKHHQSIVRHCRMLNTIYRDCNTRFNDVLWGDSIARSVRSPTNEYHHDPNGDNESQSTWSTTNTAGRIIRNVSSDFQSDQVQGYQEWMSVAEDHKPPAVYSGMTVCCSWYSSLHNSKEDISSRNRISTTSSEVHTQCPSLDCRIW